MSAPLVTLRDLIAGRIRARGPITAAAFIDLALYHPQLGYYAAVPRRSGRSGDFYTSVDVGPLFGELLAVQLAEMWRILGRPTAFDLVDAGAGDGRLARDVLDAVRTAEPAFYDAVRLHLVEVSAAARAAQPSVLGPHADRLESTGVDLPSRVAGVVVANELLDALPPHVVTMTPGGLKERLVTEADGEFTEVDGPVSTPEIGTYLARVGASLQLGWRAEVNLAAVRWMARAARCLARGFLIVIDYGHEARQLYSAAHASGTLRTFTGHTIDPASEAWLKEPGQRDITSHVDLTGVRLAAEREGLVMLAALDQTYFLLGLGAVAHVEGSSGNPEADLRRRLGLKTLLLPGGLGSTHKVLVFGRGVGRPRLQGAPTDGRLT